MIRHLAAVAAMVVMLAGGCTDVSDSEPETDHLTGPTHFRKVCVSTDRAHQWTIGVATAENTGDEAVTLESARLTEAEGVELVATGVLRPRDLVDSFGVWNGWPPRGMSPLDRRLWGSREPVDGNRVEPGERVNFVLRLRGEPGSSSGPLEVTYRIESGDEGRWTSNVEYGIGGQECE